MLLTLMYVKFLTENNILSNCQHGFRAYHSCESTLILVYEHLPRNIEQGFINGIALIDLSKAFDLVDHMQIATVEIGTAWHYSTSPKMIQIIFTNVIN